MPNPTKLSEPASPRMWVRSPENKWYQTVWTEAGVLECKAAGGWFRQGGHSFESERVASIAYSRNGVATEKAPKVPRPIFAKNEPAPTADELLAELAALGVDAHQIDLFDEFI